MTDAVAGAFLAWLAMVTWPEYEVIIGGIIVVLLIFVGGWNWHAFALKHRWIRGPDDWGKDKP